MEFKRYRIEEIGTVVGGGTPSTKNPNYYGGNIPWITPKDLANYGKRYIQYGERNITDEGLKHSSAKLVPANTILMTSRAPIGYLAIAANEVSTNQGFKSIICDKKVVSPKFFYYLLQYEMENIKSLGTGSTFNEISGKVVKNIEVNIPNIEKQKKIEDILDAVDEKIEINQHIIANLEELSQTLFKRWFVDFEFPDEDGAPYKSSGGEMIDSELDEIPKQWRVVKLETLIDNVKDRINSKLLNNNLPYVPIDLIPKRKLTFYNYKDGKEAKSSLIKFKRNDILLGNMRVYFHRVCLAPFDGVTRNTVFTLRPKDEKYTYYLISLINRDDFIEYASNNSKGSTMPYAVWEGTLDKVKIIHPPLNYLNQFNSKIKSNFELSISLLKQNRKLAILRDTLLPKLMSGEIEIPDDIEVNVDELSI